jgi:hypothetical protein
VSRKKPWVWIRLPSECWDDPPLLLLLSLNATPALTVTGPNTRLARLRPFYILPKRTDLMLQGVTEAAHGHPRPQLDRLGGNDAPLSLPANRRSITSCDQPLQQRNVTNRLKGEP